MNLLLDAHLTRCVLIDVLSNYIHVKENMSGKENYSGGWH